MPLIFPIVPSYGARVSLQFPHELKQTVQGYDYVNVQNTQPVLEFDISRNLIYENDKDAILYLFETVQGSQDYFLFDDYSDYDATSSPRYLSKNLYPYGSGYDRGVTQGVIVQDIDGVWRLAKKYDLDGAVVYRVITHPKSIQCYRGGSPISLSVAEGTGIVTGGQSGDTWTGTFYVPVRFVDDNFSYTKVGNYQYSFSNLKLREVKLDDVGVSNSFKLSTNRYFSLAFNFNSETTKKFKTIVTEFDNSFEEREQQYDYLEQRYILSQRKLLDSSDIEYLITLYRCFLGSFTVFKYYEFDNEIEDVRTFDVCLESPLEITVSMKKDIYQKALYEVNNLILKTTRLDDIEKLRTTLCKTWELLPKNGGVYRVTDHDNDLVISGNRFRAIHRFRGYAVSMSSDFNIDNTESEGVFNLDWVNEEDLVSGRFEDATINIFLTNWLTQTNFKNIFRGFVGTQTVNYSKFGARSYKFEGVSLIRDLGKNNSVVTSSHCRHKFLEQGYGKCNRAFTVSTAPSGSSVQVRTLVTGITNNITIQAGFGLDNWDGFARATLLFETGVLTGQEFLVLSGSGLTLNLMFGMKVLPEIGDTVLVTRNCDKSIQACQSYNNVENFGGFPRMPGFDGIIRSPE